MYDHISVSERLNPEDWSTSSNIFRSVESSVNITHFMSPFLSKSPLSKEETGKTTIVCNSLPLDAVGTGVLQAIQILSYINVYHPQMLIWENF